MHDTLSSDHSCNHDFKTRVIADDRERRSGLLDILANSADINLSVERMKLGDYLFDDRLLFERKTLKDLIYSIIDGRIFSQATRLAASEYQGIFILEGTSSDIKDFKMRREAIQGALIQISVIMGIPVLRSASSAETVSLMISTARQLRNVADGTIQRHGSLPKGKKRRQLMILQGLPKIGKKRAKLLLDKFESVENVVNASYEDLMELDGIGVDIADGIRHVLCEEQAEYC
jgi:ERCC4-type nuclease